MKYFGNFTCRKDVKREFSYGPDGTFEIKSFPREDKILLASYDNEDYEGSAYVLFERDGKLWEVTGGHCSCNGLEGQWDPEETNWAFIISRPYQPSGLRGTEATKYLADLIYTRTGIFVSW